MLDRKYANQTLQKTADTLEGMGAKYFIDSGTLLSAYRDKDINIYDHDVDVRILPNEVPQERTSELVKRLWDAGFYYIAQNMGDRAELICLMEIEKAITMLDLKFAFQDGKYVWVYVWGCNSAIAREDPRVHCYPSHFFQKLETIELLGREYPCPSPVEDYLVYHYGNNWREFKERADQEEMTDYKWSSLYSPPCSMGIHEFELLRAGKIKRR